MDQSIPGPQEISCRVGVHKVTKHGTELDCTVHCLLQTWRRRSLALAASVDTILVGVGLVVDVFGA